MKNKNQDFLNLNFGPNCIKIWKLFSNLQLKLCCASQITRRFLQIGWSNLHEIGVRVCVCARVTHTGFTRALCVREPHARTRAHLIHTCFHAFLRKAWWKHVFTDLKILRGFLNPILNWLLKILRSLKANSINLKIPQDL